jgi:hypothetical protein
MLGARIALDRFFDSPTIRSLSGSIDASEQARTRAELFVKQWENISQLSDDELDVLQ